MRWILTVLIIYACGFFASLLMHAIYLQMVTFPLALVRSAVWPIWVATGWPHGVPMPMD